MAYRRVQRLGNFPDKAEDRKDYIGVQARMRPILEAAVECLRHEKALGVEPTEVMLGFTAVAASMVAQVVMNTEEGFVDEQMSSLINVFASGLSSFADRVDEIISDADRKPWEDVVN